MKKLFSIWTKEARELGFTQESVPTGDIPRRHEEKEVREALAKALSEVARRGSHFAERDLVRAVATEAQARGLSYHNVMETVRHTLYHSPEIVRLGTVKREPRFTTREVFAHEEALLSHAKAAKGKNTHQVFESSVLRAIREAERDARKKEGTKLELTAEQREAVDQLTRGKDQIAIVSGEYGSGKSLVSQAGRRAFELDGYRVVQTGTKALSVSRLLNDLNLSIVDEAKHHIKQIGRTLVREIHDEFKKTPIVGRLLPRGKAPREYNPTVVDSSTVVFVEDAHKLSTHQMEELLRKVRDRGGKVCLLGNPHAVPLDGPQSLRPIARILGEATLTKNFRASDDAHEKALRALARGQTKEFLTTFAESGRLHIGRDERQAMQQMVSDWAKEGVRKPRENLLLCSTTKERTELNKLAQAEMKKAGRLGRKKMKIGDETIHKGDRVVCTSSWTGLGIENGSWGKVVRIGKRRITRDMFKGKQFLGRPRGLWAMLKYAEKVKKHSGIYVTVKLDTGKVVDIPLDYYQHIHLGYAATARDAPEAKNAFALAGHSAINRETLSSLASRSRSETRIYMNRDTAGDKLSDLARKASKSLSKEMAHDILGGNQEHRLEIGR